MCQDVVPARLICKFKQEASRGELATGQSELREYSAGATHPDVLQILAVDGVDDAVGADELDSAVDVDVYHCATLTVLRKGEGI